MTQIILTSEEIKNLYRFFYKTMPFTGFGNDYNRHNIVIKTEPCGGIGEQVFVQTQENFLNKSDKWEDITDYKSW